MSLIGALNAGKSALAVQQAALQVTGNNIANAGNSGYTRQTASIAPAADQQFQPGIFIGRGVNLTAVQRQIDEALEARIRGSVSDQASADVMQQWVGRIEAVFNELSDQDLSTQLSTFFNSWSNLANKPQDIGLRQVVLQTGDAVATWFRDIRDQMSELQTNVNQRMVAQTNEADRIAATIADLNQQITIAEGGTGGTANGLRDQRDMALKELSELLDIKTVVDKSVINVYVGSEPLVVGTDSRGVGLRQEVEDGQLVYEVIFKSNNGEINTETGQLGGLVQSRDEINQTVTDLDTLAGTLIFELNKLHASGQGLQGFGTVMGSNAVDDATLALNDPDAGLGFVPQHGSFVVHVRQKATGLVTSTLVQVDLDGTGTDTTLNSLVADIDAIANISSVATANKLQISADSADVEISFSQDSSGALAALGVNNFFTGSDARDMQVSNVVKDHPGLLAAAKNGEQGDNQTARAIAALESQAIETLQGASLKASYESTIGRIATSASSARTSAEATAAVQQTLEFQRESLSGVSLDEEAMNLMRQQRAFQGAARLIAAVDELMQTVLGLI